MTDPTPDDCTLAAKLKELLDRWDQQAAAPPRQLQSAEAPHP